MAGVRDGAATVAAGLVLGWLGLGARIAFAGSLAGWEAPASNPATYVVEIDGDRPHAGRFSAYMGCTGCSTEAPSTLMQVVRADRYRGRRVRLTAYLRSSHVERWAGLWMRVDGTSRRSLSFDNMSDRAVTGRRAIAAAAGQSIVRGVSRGSRSRSAARPDGVPPSSGEGAAVETAVLREPEPHEETLYSPRRDPHRRQSRRRP